MGGGVSESELIQCLTDLEKRVLPPLSDSGIDINSYAKKLINFATIVLMEDTNGICGIAAIYVNNIDSKAAYLSFIAVNENIAGMGYGAMLLKEAERKALNAGMNQIGLEVNNINTHAREFYKKMGYVESGIASDHSTYMVKRIETV